MGAEGYGASLFRIEDMEYSEETPGCLTVTLSGEKLEDGEGSYDCFNYQVVDSQDYVVTSGTVILHGLSAGDRFRDDSLMLFDLTPGEQYTIEFSNYS